MLCLENRKFRSVLLIPVVVVSLALLSVSSEAYGQKKRKRRPPKVRPQAAKKIKQLQRKAVEARNAKQWPKAVAALNTVSKSARKNGLIDIAFDAELEIIEIATICGGKPSTPDNWIRKSASDALELAGTSKNHLGRLEKQLIQTREIFQDPKVHKNPANKGDENVGSLEGVPNHLAVPNRLAMHWLKNGQSVDFTMQILSTIENQLATIREVEDAQEISANTRRSHSAYLANLVEYGSEMNGKKNVELYDAVHNQVDEIIRVNKDSVVIDEPSRKKVEAYLSGLATIDQFRPDYHVVAKHATDAIEGIYSEDAPKQKRYAVFAESLIEVIDQHAKREELSSAHAYAKPAFLMAERAYAGNPEIYSHWLTSFTDALFYFQDRTADLDKNSVYEKASNELVSTLQNLHGETDMKTISAAMKLLKWQHDRVRLRPEKAEQFMEWMTAGGKEFEPQLLDCHVYLMDHYLGTAERAFRKGTFTWRVEPVMAVKVAKHIDAAIPLAKRHAPKQIDHLNYRRALIERGIGHEQKAVEILKEIVKGSRSPYTLLQAESAHVLARITRYRTMVDRGPGLKPQVSLEACHAMDKAINMYDNVYRNQPKLLNLEYEYDIRKAVRHNNENEILMHFWRIYEQAKHRGMYDEDQYWIYRYRCREFCRLVQKSNEEPEKFKDGLDSIPKTRFLLERHFQVLDDLKKYIERGESDALTRKEKETVQLDFDALEPLAKLHFAEKAALARAAAARRQTPDEAIRDYKQRIMNSGGIGIWGLIRFVEVNQAGLPTGR